MRKPSDPSSAPRRKPSNERGERRVVELLEAAAAIIGDVGYEAATMTEIARRAGASIGAVYQYFPNKEAIGRALQLHYGAELRQRWTALAEDTERLDTATFADRLISSLMRFIAERPAFVPLTHAAIPYPRDIEARHRLRAQFAALFRRKNPRLGEDESFRIALVAIEMTKTVHPLFAMVRPGERDALLQELKRALTDYLVERLGA